MRSPLAPHVRRSRRGARRSGPGRSDRRRAAVVSRAREILAGVRTAVADAGPERDGRDRAHQPRTGAARRGRARGGGAARRGLLEPRARARCGRPGQPPEPRRGAAVRAHRRRGRDRRQQRRGGRAARRGGAGGAGPCDRRLPRPAGGDRRRVPHPRGDRPVGRDAGGGGHDQPDAGPRLRVGDRRLARLPVGAILRVHPSNFRSLGFVEDVSIEAAVRTRRPGDRRRRLRRPRRRERDPFAVRGAVAAKVGRRRARRLCAARATSCSAARRRGCCWARLRRWRPRARIPLPGRCGSTSCRWPRSRRR